MHLYATVKPPPDGITRSNISSCQVMFVAWDKDPACGAIKATYQAMSSMAPSPSPTHVPNNHSTSDFSKAVTLATTTPAMELYREARHLWFRLLLLPLAATTAIWQLKALELNVYCQHPLWLHYLPHLHLQHHNPFRCLKRETCQLMSPPRWHQPFILVHYNSSHSPLACSIADQRELASL